MPLYEGIGLISDKHAVVIDIGAAYTKCGFAGETGPRCIIRTEILDRKSKKIINIAEHEDKEHLYQLLIDFIHHLYFKHLLVNPKDRRVVVVESPFVPTVFRETLSKVLFVHYEVSSLLLAPSPMMSLFTLGISSALVVDAGYNETQVMPIYEGIVMVNSGESVPLAGKALHRAIEDLIMQTGTVSTLLKESPVSEIMKSIDEKILEDIKVRSCFITTFERGRLLQEAKNHPDDKAKTSPIPPPDLHYSMDGENIVCIPGTVREEAAEILFELDNDMKSIATIIINCILKCPIDMRRLLAENIVLLGGTAMMPGFKSRLMVEIKSLLNHPYYKNRLAIKNFKYHQTPAKDNYTAWLGGAIFGATDVVTTRSFTRKDYTDRKCIPDWSDLNHTTFRNEENNGL